MFLALKAKSKIPSVRLNLKFKIDDGWQSPFPSLDDFLSLSAFPFELRGQLRLWLFFYSVFKYHIFGVGLSSYFSNHSLSSREHIFVGFNKFPSLMCWCTVIHHHWPQGPTLFQRVKWDFTCVQCNVCTDMQPPVLNPRRLGNVQSIP